MKWCPERDEEEEGAMGSSSSSSLRAAGNGDDVESNREEEEDDDDGAASFTSALESLMEEASTGESEDFKKFDPDKLKTQKVIGN